MVESTSSATVSIATICSVGSKLTPSADSVPSSACPEAMELDLESAACDSTINTFLSVMGEYSVRLLEAGGRVDESFSMYVKSGACARERNRDPFRACVRLSARADILYCDLLSL